MEWKLIRKDCDDRNSLGEIYVGDRLIGYSIEDAEREKKIPRVTAIPRGRYLVIRTPSQRFQRETLQLMDVPGFAGIRIHAGNTEEDTEGCIIPGLRRGTDAVYDSRRCVAELDKWYDAATEKKEDVWITVEGLDPEPWKLPPEIPAVDDEGGA